LQLFLPPTIGNDQILVSKLITSIGPPWVASAGFNAPVPLENVRSPASNCHPAGATVRAVAFLLKDRKFTQRYFVASEERINFLCPQRNAMCTTDQK
jgi:hypothetical protein